MMNEQRTAAAGGFNNAAWLRPAAAAALVLLAVAAGAAFAANGGGSDTDVNSSFTELRDMLVGLMQGTLGSVIALALILCGGFISVRTQSLWGFVIGIAMALGMIYSPDIVTSLASATGAADPSMASPFDPASFDPRSLL